MPRFRNIGAVTGLAVLLAVSFWLLDLLRVVSQRLQVDIAAMFAGSDIPNLSDELVFQHHEPSLCCDDFVRGGQLALIFMLLSGLPMALAAHTAAFATRRRSPKLWKPSAAGMLRACFVLQWCSFMLCAFLTVPSLWIDWRGLISEWQGVFLLVTMMASASGLPAWRAAALAVAAPAPISILGWRSNGVLRMRATPTRPG